MPVQAEKGAGMDWYYVEVFEGNKGTLAKSQTFFTKDEANQEHEDFIALYPNHVSAVINGQRGWVCKQYLPLHEKLKRERMWCRPR